MDDVNKRMTAKKPQSLTSQFENRSSRDRAIKRHKQRDLLENVLYPPGMLYVLNLLVRTIPRPLG